MRDKNILCTFYLLKIHAQIRDFVALSMATPDWMRIGAFFFDLPVAFLTEKLIPPVKRPQEETTVNVAVEWFLHVEQH